MKSLVLSALLIFSLSSFAHEGAHGPEQKMAPHEGVLKDGKALMGELVQDVSGVKVYLLTHNSKAISPKDAKIDVKSVQLTDAKKKNVSVEIISEQDAILVKFDKASSYRFNLTLPVSYGNAQDKLSWQFEPQSN